MTDRSWSYSVYSDLARCPRLFNYKYVQKISVPKDLDSNLLFGSTLHDCLNKSLTGHPDPIQAFIDTWSAYSAFDVQYHREGHGQLLSLGEKFIRNFNLKYAPKMKLLQGETRLYGDYGGCKIEGTPDAVIEYEGRTYLTDFKTSAYNYDKSKAKSSLQLNMYAYLVETQTNTKVDALMYVVFNKGTGSIQTPLVVEYSRAKAEEMIADLVTTTKAWSDVYEEAKAPRNPNACFFGKHRCDYYEKCWT